MPGADSVPAPAGGNEGRFCPAAEGICRIDGYKVAVLARGVRHLTIDNLDVSDNWAPRLWSGLGHESLVDWLYYHHNEKDEWLRYGAGIYLADVTDGMIRGSIARGGQNGLLVVRQTAPGQVAVWDYLGSLWK
jgi:hypothetical protein